MLLHKTFSTTIFQKLSRLFRILIISCIVTHIVQFHMAHYDPVSTFCHVLLFAFTGIRSAMTILHSNVPSDTLGSCLVKRPSTVMHGL